MTKMFVGIINTCRICGAGVSPVEPQRLFYQAEKQVFQRAHRNCIKNARTQAKNVTKLTKPVEVVEGVLMFPKGELNG